MERIRKIADRVFSVELYRYALLVVTLLNTVMLFYQVSEQLNPILLLWGGCVLIRDLLTKRNLFFNRGRGFLLAFLAFYLVSIFVAGRNQLYGNLVVFAYTALNLLLLYSYSLEQDREEVIRDLKRFLTIFVGFTVLTGIANMVIYYGHLSIPYVSTVDGEIEYMGHVDNRLWGVNGNPNPGGIMSVYSIACSVMLMAWVKEHQCVKRVLLGGNIFLQLMTIGATKSRGAELALIIFLAVSSMLGSYLVFAKRREKKAGGQEKSGKIVWAKVADGGLSVAIALVVAVGSFWALGENQMLLAQSDALIQAAVRNEDWETVKQNINIERPDLQNPNGDVSNGRSRIWEQGFKIIRDYPMFGVSFKNVEDKANEYYGQDKPLTGVDGGGMHNVFLQATVSNGLVGLVCFVGALLVFVIGGVKYLWGMSKRPSRRYLMLLFAFLCLVLTFNLTESKMLYSISYSPLLFWYLLGVTMFLIGKDTGEGDQNTLFSRLDRALQKKTGRSFAPKAALPDSELEQ